MFRSRIFHSYGDVTIDGEGLQNVARHFRPVNREGLYRAISVVTRGLGFTVSLLQQTRGSEGLYNQDPHSTIISIYNRHYQYKAILSVISGI